MPVDFTPLRESDWARFHNMITSPKRHAKATGEESDYDSNSSEDDYGPEAAACPKFAAGSNERPAALRRWNGHPVVATLSPQLLAGFPLMPPAASGGRTGSMMVLNQKGATLRRVSSFLDRNKISQFGQRAAGPTLDLVMEEAPVNKPHQEQRPIQHAKRYSMMAIPASTTMTGKMYGPQVPAVNCGRNLMVRKMIVKRSHCNLVAAAAQQQTPPRRRSAMVVPNAPHKHLIDDDCKVVDSSEDSSSLMSISK